MTDIQTITSYYLSSLDNPKIIEEIRDILYNHFETVKNSKYGVDQEYFNNELQLAITSKG